MLMCNEILICTVWLLAHLTFYFFIHVAIANLVPMMKSKVLIKIAAVSLLFLW